ncbi:MAG TPA: PDZ domain-containing protein [Vicinamibacterales bacterium]|nr:PDZ domain-containing protein [Vicinamibacterales bacterium]
MPTSRKTDPTRWRISRETRQLLTAAVLALAALWALARIRYPAGPPTPNPIPSLLSLAPMPRFSNLAGEIEDLQKSLSPFWLVAQVSVSSGDTGTARVRSLAALRLRDDAAVVLLGDNARLSDNDSIIAADSASGLTLFRTRGEASDSVPAPWTPPDLGSPHYLMATSASPAGISLNPVLVGSLYPVRSAAWSGPIWVVPEGTYLETGAFLFTTSGELAGVAALEPDGTVIVPGDVVLADSMRLLERGSASVVDVPIEVQPLTPALARATGARTGVVVAWVDPEGAASARLKVGDVIEAVDGQPAASVRDWDVLTRRLSTPGVNLRVWRRGSFIDVPLSLPALESEAPAPAIGMTMRDLPGVGSSVLEVVRGSPADRARLLAGDVITLAGGASAPTPEHIRNTFAAARAGEPILIALTRGRNHLVIALVK